MNRPYPRFPAVGPRCAPAKAGAQIVKTTLDLRPPISSTPRNQQKQRDLKRHENRTGTPAKFAPPAFYRSAYTARIADGRIPQTKPNSGDSWSEKRASQPSPEFGRRPQPKETKRVNQAQKNVCGNGSKTVTTVTLRPLPEPARPLPASIKRVILTKKCRLANLVIEQ